MKKHFLFICFITYLTINTRLIAQVNDSITDVQPLKKQLTPKQKYVLGALAAHQLATFYLEYKWWWEGNYHPFVMSSDGGFNNYSLGIDKVGHFYTSYVYFKTLNELMRWGEFKPKTRLWVSTAIPLVWALSIEIGDGFSSYEFSPGDLAANTLGIAYGLAQEKFPYLKNFNFKYSYFPTRYFLDNHFYQWKLTSDYGGHIYWISADINNLLAKPVKRFWPKYLNLAFGYGIADWATGRKFCLGLDWNLGAFTTKNKTVQTVKNILDFYHYPAPGIKKTGTESIKFEPILLN